MPPQTQFGFSPDDQLIRTAKVAGSADLNSKLTSIPIQNFVNTRAGAVRKHDLTKRAAYFSNVQRSPRVTH